MVEVVARVLLEVFAIAADLSKFFEIGDTLTGLLLLELPVLGNRMVLELCHRSPVLELGALH